MEFNLNHLIELKPCPFCGGRAEFGGNVHTGYFVECLTCGTTDPLPNLNFSMEEVAAAWNTRAERTCRNDALKGAEGVFICSECGVYLDIADMEWDGEDESGGFYEPNYCPNCGARVVDS